MNKKPNRGIGLRGSTLSITSNRMQHFLRVSSDLSGGFQGFAPAYCGYFEPLLSLAPPKLLILDL